MLRRPTMRVAAASAAAFATLLLAQTASAGEAIRIEMKSMGFMPAQASARVGDAIEWVNSDFVAHTATARNGAWDVTIPPGATRRIVLDRAGTIAYYCRFHPNMTGELRVAE